MMHIAQDEDIQFAEKAPAGSLSVAVECRKPQGSAICREDMSICLEEFENPSFRDDTICVTKVALCLLTGPALRNER